MKSLSRDQSRFYGIMLLVLALHLPYSDCSAEPTSIGTNVPDRIRVGTKFVFYLHGRIVEEQGRAAFSREFGRYQYDAILAELGATPAFVISEVRARDTDVSSYADKLVAQVNQLIDAGVRASDVTIVGASKGAIIAAAVATRLRNPDIRYVMIGGCADSAPGWQLSKLSGSILWILETTDVRGERDCSAEFRAAKGLRKSKTVHLNTGLKHGFLYRPLTEWLVPTQVWITAQ